MAKDPVEKAKEGLREIMVEYADRPSELTRIVDDMGRDRWIKELFFIIRHPLIQRHKLLALIYLSMQMFLSAVFLVTGLMLVIPSSEQEFHSAISSILDLLLTKSVGGTRLIAFFLGLALLIMCIITLSDAGEMLHTLGLTEE